MGRSMKVNQERGTSTLELAIAVPILLLMLLAIVDLGGLLYTGIEVANAARAGVAYGIQSAKESDLTGMQTAAVNDAGNVTGLTATASQFCTCSNGNAQKCSSGKGNCQDWRTYVEVDTQASYQTLISYPGIPSPITVTGKAVMRAQ